MSDYRLFLLLLAGTVCCGLPQNMFATAVKAIAVDTHAPSVDDLAARMASAYWLIAGPLGAIAGALADQLPRRRVLLGSALLCALSTCLASTAGTHTLLLLARAGQGAAAGAFLPAAYSAVADLLPDESARPAYAARLGMVMGIGAALPQLALGGVGPTWWRAVAALCAGLATVVTVLLWLAWPEPRRGSSPGPGRGKGGVPTLSPSPSPLALLPGAGRGMVQVTRVSTNRYILSQGLMGTIPWTIVSLFLPPALLSSMTSQHASLVMLTFGLGGLLGGVLGGKLGAWAYRQAAHPHDVLPKMVGALQACGAVPVSLLVLAHAYAFMCKGNGTGTGAGSCQGHGLAGQGLLPSVALLAIAAIAGVVSSMAGPNLRSMLLAVNPPSGRATAFALGSLLDALAKGIAPLLIAQALQWAGEEVTTRAWTLCAAIVLGWCGSGLLIAYTAASFGEDERRAKQEGQD